MPTSPAEVAASATTCQIAAGTPSRGPLQASLRRSTVNPTDSPSGPSAENLTSCAAHGFAPGAQVHVGLQRGGGSSAAQHAS